MSFRRRKNFSKCWRDAFDLASRGRAIVTIGIKPTEPATGYGYIHVGEPLPPPHGVKAIQNHFLQRRTIRGKTLFRQALGICEQRALSLERGHVHLVVRDHHGRSAKASARNVRRPASAGSKSPEHRKLDKVLAKEYPGHQKNLDRLRADGACAECRRRPMALSSGTISVPGPPWRAI